MTKVKFLESISTADHSYAPHEEHTLEDHVAAPWIKSGVCVSLEPVKTPAQVKAEKAAAEKAASDKRASEKAEAEKAAAAAKKAVDDATFERELAELEKAEAAKLAAPVVAPAAEADLN